MLSPNQLEHYKTHGFLVLKQFASVDECRVLRDRAEFLVDNSGPVVDPRCAYDTEAKGSKFVSHEFFLESTNNVSLFFEASAIGSDGTMLKDKNRAIVKIGHALHDFDPVFEAYTHSSRMHMIAKLLGYKKPLVGQSRYYFKNPDIKMAIPTHQDSSALFTQPLSCFAVWLAIDKATTKNGCMWVIPGSHHAGIRSRHVKNNIDGQIKSEPRGKFAPLDKSEFRALEVDIGTAVILSGEVIHKSLQNITTSPRHAYTVHFIEGDESFKYPSDNWLQRPGGFGELRDKPACHYNF